jgi:hypothetical protein
LSRTSFSAVLVLALTIPGWSCISGFPGLVLDDDGDGFPFHDDCQDQDTAFHPAVDECARIQAEPLDHDCNGRTDGGALPFRDEFETEPLEGWTGNQSLAHWRIRGGRLEQQDRANVDLSRVDGAECWQDVEAEFQVFPNPSAPELNCSFYLRTSGRAENADVLAPASYQFKLHHHSNHIDGVNQDWDGCYASSLSRTGSDGEQVYLVGDNGERSGSAGGGHCPDSGFIGGGPADPAPAWFLITLGAREVGDGEGGTATELSCRYQTDLTSDDEPCFPEVGETILDPGDARPLTGGFGLSCWLVTFTDRGEPDEQQGLAFDYIEIREPGP